MGKKCNPVRAVHAAVTDKPCPCLVCVGLGDDREVSIAFCNLWQVDQMLEAAEGYAETNPKFRSIWQAAKTKKMEKPKT